MARKSRKHLNTETVMKSTPKENVGYIRLSVSNKEESNSIENQELICKGWFLPSNTYDCGSFVVN